MGTSKDLRVEYDDTFFVQRYGSHVTGNPRLLWKLKFIHLYNEYKKAYFPELPDDYVVKPKTTAGSLFQLHKRVGSAVMTRDTVVRVGEDEDGVPRDIVPHEVARFLAKRFPDSDHEDDRQPPLDLDPLLWWKANQRRYPVIAKMAADILAMQAASVETERVNSAGRTTIDWNQSRMGPEAVEASVKLKMFAMYNRGDKSVQNVGLSDGLLV